MEKNVQITLIIAGAVILLALIGTFVFLQSGTSANTVSVDGTAKVKATPDLVAVYFNVETNGDDAKEAKDENAEIVDKVITSLLKKGFERKDIETQNFNIYPRYVWEDNENKQKGYTATHSLRIVLKSSMIAKTGDVIDAGVDAGAAINYINFELSQEKQNNYKAEALKLATQDAKIKAEAIASGIGKKVGKVISISTVDFGYSPWPLFARAEKTGVMEAKAAATNIQPGEEDIYANIKVEFAIK